MVLKITVVEQYYDQTASKWVKRLRNEPQKYVYSTFFKSLYKNAHGKRSLDIGCGAGIFTLKLAELGFDEVIAVDISETMLRYLDKEARAKNLNILTKKGDAYELPVESDSVDFVISVGLLECLDDHLKALKEIKRVLKPGGIASIRWVNRGGLWGTIEKIKRFIGLQNEPFVYNDSKKHEIEGLVRDAGLTMNKFDGMVCLPLFMFPWPLKQILSTVLLRTGIGYWIESKHLNESFYYSFCTELVN